MGLLNVQYLAIRNKYTNITKVNAYSSPNGICDHTFQSDETRIKDYLLTT